MRTAGCSVRVAKNRLAKIALKDKQCEGVASYLKGMTVLAYSEDPVAAAKVVEDYAKANRKLVVRRRSDRQLGAGPGRCEIGGIHAVEG